VKKCPFCAEEIQDEAIVCKHCGRDLTAPQSKNVAILRRNLENRIQSYISSGYELVSGTETTAVLERRAPVNAVMMIALFLLLWPAAIVYALPAVRKQYRARLNVSPDGQVNEFGGTVAEFERDRNRSKKVGWIIIGITIAIVVGIVVLGFGSY